MTQGGKLKSASGGAPRRKKKARGGKARTSKARKTKPVKRKRKNLDREKMKRAINNNVERIMVERLRKYGPKDNVRIKLIKPLPKNPILDIGKKNLRKTEKFK